MLSEFLYAAIWSRIVEAFTSQPEQAGEPGLIDAAGSDTFHGRTCSGSRKRVTRRLLALTDTDSLPALEVIAAEIADDLEAALEQFTRIAARLGENGEASLAT